MTMLDLDRLFVIAEASPKLDLVEEELRAAGHVAEADALNKLQQDAGVQIDREMNGYDPDEPAAGPVSAQLNAAYEVVTGERLDVLSQAQGLVSSDGLKNDLGKLIQALNPPGRTPGAAGPETPKP